MTSSRRRILKGLTRLSRSCTLLLCPSDTCQDRGGVRATKQWQQLHLDASIHDEDARRCVPVCLLPVDKSRTKIMGNCVWSTACRTPQPAPPARKKGRKTTERSGFSYDLETFIPSHSGTLLQALRLRTWCIRQLGSTPSMLSSSSLLSGKRSWSFFIMSPTAISAWRGTP